PPPTPHTTLFPYTTLFRSACSKKSRQKPPSCNRPNNVYFFVGCDFFRFASSNLSGESATAAPFHSGKERMDTTPWNATPNAPTRSEEHTSELQSLRHLVCR